MRHVTDADTSSGGERRAMSPDDALPPVEPPSAGFIIKLFVVPALIVAVVVGVVLCFQWIAQSEVDVKSYLDAIERNANNAWQCANDLAYLLHQDEKLRTDEPTATRLSGMVTARINSGPPKGDKDQISQEVGVRVFLCKALGEFATPAALPGLVDAARPARDAGAGATDEALAKIIRDGQFEVRKAALEGLALLAHNVRLHGQSVPTTQVLPIVLAASREVGPDAERAIRERAAYTLGVIGGEQATSRLVEMLGDLYANVRFNAATGLARHGNAQGLDVLREMIDPTESVPVDLNLDTGGITGNISEADMAKLRSEMEGMIRFAGLSAVEQLARANPEANLDTVATAIDKLLGDPATHPHVKSKAQEVRNLLRPR
jgi:hypothetical protein